MNINYFNPRVALSIPKKSFLISLLFLMVCHTAVADDILVFGRLITNEPMEYVEFECPEDAICLHSWWKSVIRVEKTIQGKPLSGLVTTAIMQHTGLNPEFKKSVRLYSDQLWIKSNARNSA